MSVKHPRRPRASSFRGNSLSAWASRGQAGLEGQRQCEAAELSSWHFRCRSASQEASWGSAGSERSESSESSGGAGGSEVLGGSGSSETSENSDFSAVSGGSAKRLGKASDKASQGEAREGAEARNRGETGKNAGRDFRSEEVEPRSEKAEESREASALRARGQGRADLPDGPSVDHLVDHPVNHPPDLSADLPPEPADLSSDSSPDLSVDHPADLPAEFSTDPPSDLSFDHPTDLPFGPSADLSTDLPSDPPAELSADLRPDLPPNLLVERPGASIRGPVTPPQPPRAFPRALPGLKAAPISLRPLERLVGLYALLSSFALFFPGRPESWPLLLAVHLAFACLLLPARWLALPAAAARAVIPLPLLRFVRDWYPMLLMPWIYGEVAILNTAVHQGRYFDPLVVNWEAALFGGQPSQIFSATLPSLLLSEVLHAAYFAYYLILYAPALILWIVAIRKGETSDRFHALLFPMLVTFFLCELSFILFPVAGPRYHFPPAPVPEGPFSTIVRMILEGASSQGTAFPSSHAALSVAQTIVVGRFLPRLYRLCVALTFGLCLGAVYGGYHYAIDMVVGVLVGLFGVWLADRFLPPGRSTGDSAKGLKTEAKGQKRNTSLQQA